MRPNTSFLWRGKDLYSPAAAPAAALAPPPPSPLPPALPARPRLMSQEQIKALATEALKEEELRRKESEKQEEREENEEEEGVYDDVHPLIPCSTEEDEYDDVGVWRGGAEKDEEKAEEAKEDDDGYEYCRSPSPPPYDDCADAPNPAAPAPPPAPAPAAPNRHDEDIYDDVKSLLAIRAEEEEEEEETASLSNCYESIYDASAPAPACAAPARVGGSSASSVASGGGGGGGSSCDQSNSLYGASGSLGGYSQAPSRASSSTGSGGGVYGVGGVYQALAPRSETSDEWMDVEPSDSEPDRPLPRPTALAYLLLQERLRSRKSPSWSRKVRNQWSKARNGDCTYGEGNSTDSEDHNYETLEDVQLKSNGSLCGEDSDSFESDVSESNAPVNSTSLNDVADKQLPEPPVSQNIYGISKIAEVAGKKMLELGRSLRKMRTRHNTVGSERLLGTEVTSSKSPVMSLLVKDPVPQPPSPTSPATIQKMQSTGNLSGRKTWTLRKFRRSFSGSSAPSTSTFYLSSPVDICIAPTEEVPASNGHHHSVDLKEDSKSSNELDAPRLSSNLPLGKLRPLMNSSRRGSGAARPNSPPPLPPHSVSETARKSNKKERESPNTSWYTECGLFDQPYDSLSKSASKIDKPISNSWYAAVGLWGASAGNSEPKESDVSDQDSSCHSETADSTYNQDVGIKSRSCFPDEPLYQFYIGTIAEIAQSDVGKDFDSDGYEEIGNQQKMLTTRPSAMELIQPKDGLHRSLWCEIPEVVNSQVLSTLSPSQKKLQEAKFEIITSEASYMNSLNVLEQHFMASPDLNDDSILTKNDRRILFGNVSSVKKCSENFLSDLEKCWQDNILLHGICDTILHHATNYFNVYVKYCSNQIYLDRTLRRLKEQQCRFAEVLSRLEASPKCQLLSLHSFLMLPMQRVTRMPLLIDAVLTRLDSNDSEYKTCELALATLNKVVQDCNEGARHMERMEQILILSRQIEFPREVKSVPIISSSRYLVRSGELIQLVWRGDDAKLTFGKKLSKVTLHVFLFTDLLVITKKRSEECYTVVDYCPRNLVQISGAEGIPHLPVKYSADSGRNLILLTILQNHEKKTIEMVLSCPLESDRQRWLEAVSEPMSDNPDERVYEEWDCPQVIAIHSYVASQPDELSLDVSDVVNVLRKMTDGWYQGERIRDGERGWFPGNYTLEIASAHVRARNLKQRYRLLALSGNFVESQRKERVYK